MTLFRDVIQRESRKRLRVAAKKLVPTSTQDGSIVAAGAVRIGGALYNASVSATAGELLAVQNTGSAANATYSAAGAGASVLAVGGSGGAGGGTSGAHIMSDISVHVGTLADSQAPQFLLLGGARPMSGSLNMGGNNITSVGTINGYSLNVLTPTTFVAGSGLTGGGSDTDTTVTFNVGAGNGIAVTADAVTIAKGATLTFTGNDLDVNTATLAGDGLQYTATQLYVNHDSTLLIASDQLGVNEASAFQWTANHSHTGTISSNPWVSGVQGWGVTALGVADFREIFADRLTVEAFVSDINLALAGSEIITKSLGTLSRDFTTPTTTGTLYVYDLPGFPDTQVFENGDWVRLRYVQRGTGLIVGDVWGTVSGYADLGNGEQSWTFTRQSGSSGQTIFAGMVALDYGTSGQGIIHSTTLQANSPYMDIATWTSNPYTSGNFDTHVRIGNLDGITSGALSPSGWGLYSDNVFLEGSVVAAAGDVRLDDVGVTLHAGTGIPSGDWGTYTNYLIWSTDPASVGDANITTYMGSARTTGSPTYNRFDIGVRAGATTGTNRGRVQLAALYEETPTTHFVQLNMDAIQGASVSELLASGTGSRVQLSAADGEIWLYSDTVRPIIDLSSSLGTGTYRWKELHVGTLYTGTISSTDTGHNHNDLYYSKSEVNTLLSSKSNTGHTHAEYAIAADTYTESEVDALLAGKASSTHNHNSTYVPLTRVVISGGGLLGGGALTSDVILSVEAGDGIWISGGVAVNSTVARRNAANTFSGNVTLGAGYVLAMDSGNKAAITMDAGYEVGVQTNTSYIRTPGRFSVYASGTYASSENSAGTGGTVLMTVTSAATGLKHMAHSVLTMQNVVAGSNISVSEAAGQITISATGIDLSTASGTLAWAKVDKTGSNLTDIATRPHSAITHIGTDDHHAKQHALNDTAHHSGKLDWTQINQVGGEIPDSALAHLATRAHSDLEFIGAEDHHALVTIAGASAFALSVSGQQLSIADVFVRNTGDTIQPTGDTVPLTLDTQSGHSASLFVINLNGATRVQIDAGGHFRNGGTFDQDIGTYTAPWRSLYANNLRVTNIVAADVRATMGGDLIVANTLQLTRDIGASDTTIYVNANSFISGEWVQLRGFVGGGAQFEILKITSSPTTITANAEYSYTVTRGGSVYNPVFRTASGLADIGLHRGLSSLSTSTQTGLAWKKESAVVSLGATVGSGFIELTATTTIDGHLGPVMNVYSRSGTDTWSEIAPVVSIGNLRGLLDYGSDTPGIAIGNNNNLAPTSPAFRGLTADATNGMRLFNTPITFRDSTLGAATIRLDDNGLAIGNNVNDGYTGSGVAIYLGRLTESPSYGNDSIVWGFKMSSNSGGGGIFVNEEGMLIDTDSLQAGGGNKLDRDGLGILSGDGYSGAATFYNTQNPQNSATGFRAVMRLDTSQDDASANLLTQGRVFAYRASNDEVESQLVVGASGTPSATLTFSSVGLTASTGVNRATFAAAVSVSMNGSYVPSWLPGLQITNTNTSAPALRVLYSAQSRMEILATSTANELILHDFANGANGYGPMLTIGRNSDDTAGSPGCIKWVNRDDEIWYLWIDRNGALRRGNTRPTYDTDVSAGTLIG